MREGDDCKSVIWRWCGLAVLTVQIRIGANCVYPSGFSAVGCIFSQAQANGRFAQ